MGIRRKHRYRCLLRISSFFIFCHHLFVIETRHTDIVKSDDLPDIVFVRKLVIGGEPVRDEHIYHMVDVRRVEPDLGIRRNQVALVDSAEPVKTSNTTFSRYHWTSSLSAWKFRSMPNGI